MIQVVFCLSIIQLKALNPWLLINEKMKKYTFWKRIITMNISQYYFWFVVKWAGYFMTQITTPHIPNVTKHLISHVWPAWLGLEVEWRQSSNFMACSLKLSLKGTLSRVNSQVALRHVLLGVLCFVLIFSPFHLSFTSTH